MVGEAVVAALVGIVALWLLLQPLVRSSPSEAPPFEPLDPEETPKGIALTALKEIEFDRETGKLSEPDYEFLKAKYTSAALEALRGESPVAEQGAPDDIEAMISARVRALRSASATAPSDSPAPPVLPSRVCRICGPRPEPDAVFCSACGQPLAA